MHHAEIAIANGLLFDTEPAPRCEYRSPQFDSGTGVGQFIQCRNQATTPTDRGPRCDDHRRD